MLLRPLISLLLCIIIASPVIASTPPPEPEPEPDPPSTGIENGRYVLTNQYSNLVLTVAGGSSADGANVIQDNFSNGSHQQWDITSLGNGSYSIRPAHSNKSLDVYEWNAEDGADARQWPPAPRP